MLSQFDVEADEHLEALKLKARALRKKRVSFAKIAAEVGRSQTVVRRWCSRRATGKQTKSYDKYRSSEKGQEAQRRYEAKRSARRKAAADNYRQAIGQMFD